DLLGGADLAAWFAWRFPGYHVVYGPTEGDRQGNLLLSRYRTAAEGSLRFPRLAADEQRGLTWVRVPTAGGDFTFIVTHFSAWKDEEADRMGQAEGILAFWRGQPHTAVAGDLNQTPDGPPIRCLTDGGLADLAAAAGLGGKPTFSSRRPSRRIDYLFGSADLQVTHAGVPESAASDHLPVVVAVRLP
ncbi:MAG TPA: endonuclease/exonuclease/phosphatase family protein, partial [Symbiobacteriaceae bacterium]|nr:endonuclease/exonuclease/phosphatase family protein [Symbiobacteriaceae bacterium]